MAATDRVTDAPDKELEGDTEAVALESDIDTVMGSVAVMGSGTLSVMVMDGVAEMEFDLVMVVVSEGVADADCASEWERVAESVPPVAERVMGSVAVLDIDAVVDSEGEAVREVEMDSDTVAVAGSDDVTVVLAVMD